MGRGKGGRPTKYDEKKLQQAGYLCAKGFTNLELAEFFEVDEKTIYNWKDKHPEFFQTLNENKNKFDDEVEEALRKRATGYVRTIERLDKEGCPVACSEELPPDPTSMIFWLKNRRPKQWRDKQEHEHTGDITVIIDRSPKDAD